jgi:hypothetical protein
LEIWRIEKLQAVPVPKESYGKFFTGDSYIVLKVLSFAHIVNMSIPILSELPDVRSATVSIAYIFTPKTTAYLLPPHAYQITHPSYKKGLVVSDATDHFSILFMLQ